jgi:hypothetical protein
LHSPVGVNENEFRAQKTFERVDVRCDDGRESCVVGGQDRSIVANFRALPGSIDIFEESP